MLLLRKTNIAKFARAGDQARDQRNWAVAVENYARAIEQDESLAWLWVQYGHALKEHGLKQEAEEAYRRSIELEPENGDTFLQLGHVLKLQGRTAEAATAYLSSVTLDAKSLHARNELLAMGWSASDIQQGKFSLFGGKLGENASVANVCVAARAQPRKSEALPAGYVEHNPDIAALIRMGLVQSASQHFRLYGRSEGREIVQSLQDVAPTNAFVLCPSYGKRCGIGEHARYVFNSLVAAGFKTTAVRSTRELAKISAEDKRDSVLIVNHGPGLFDGYNPELSEGEATSDLLAGLMSEFRQSNLRPIIYMHSLLDRDNEVMFGRQKLLLDFPIPVITTISSASEYFRLPHVEHGVQPLAREYEVQAKRAEERDYPTIGFFGFFQWGGKDFDALIGVARKLKAKLIGSVATSSKYDEEKLRQLLTDANLTCDLGTGWVTDDELARRLAPADFYYLPQKDYDHWNNSGTARFVANFQKPILLPPHHPFLDLREVVIFAEENDLPAIVSYLREGSAYSEAKRRVESYAKNFSMRDTVASIAKDLPLIYQNGGLRGFWSPNARSLQGLAALEADVLMNRLAHIGMTQDAKETVSVENLVEIHRNAPDLLPLRFQQVEEIEIWRRHYTLAELYQANTQDFVVGLYRRLVKREPTFFEYRMARSALPVQWGVPNQAFASAVLHCIARVMIADQASSEPESVEVYHEGCELTPSELLNPSVELLRSFNERSVNATAKIGSEILATRDEFSVGAARNLFALLTLPPEHLEKALGEVCRAENVDIDLSNIGQHSTPRDRYMYIVHSFSNVGKKVSDVFVLDEPIVQRVDYSRRTYCVSEFVLFDGDAFIIDMIRKLSKRNPQTVEFFHLGHILDEQGKLAALREFVTTNLLEASVIDLPLGVDLEAENPTSVSDAHFRRLISDFRSPTAGGWSARNRHLEDKRAFSRFWIKAKAHRDIWWIQSGANISALQI